MTGDLATQWSPHPLHAEWAFGALSASREATPIFDALCLDRVLADAQRRQRAERARSRGQRWQPKRRGRGRR